MSWPEIVLWRSLKRHSGGDKFHKQLPAGSFVLDFFCAEARLAIEVDGEAHGRGDQPAFDEACDRQLSWHGIATLRVPATSVLRDCDAVVLHIAEAIRSRLPPHHLPEEANGPPPRAGEA